MIPKTVPLDKTHATEDSPKPLDETPVSPTDQTLTPDAVPATSRALAGLTGPQKIGRYVFLERVGEGGMGVVLAAYDPALDRRVAIKLIHTLRSDDSERRLRMEREAQAMAKLSHPNVVTVYEVSEYEGQLFVAMEFVKGQDLRKWLAQRQEGDWRAVLGMFMQAGQGLAAAHRAGLVHRDFKPDNVFVGEDGRARVGDFGLARQGAATDAETMAMHARARVETDSTALMYPLTATGATMGTPAYMAPEQFNGQATDARTDQFSFCAALWEALYGQRPFAGWTLAELFANVTAGTRVPPPAARGRGVPGWLRRVIDRGLATDPAQRWPTMAALLAALARGQTRARMRTAAGVLAGVVVLGAGAEGYRRWDIARRVAVCEATGAEIEEAWNDVARMGLRAAFMTAGVSYAETTADKVLPWLDERAGAWKQARIEVCLNGDVRALWSEDLVDRGLWCLEDRQMELAALVDELGRANAMTVQKALTAVTGLRGVDGCLDGGLLQRQPAPPAQGRVAIRDVRALLSRARSLQLAGNFKEALTVATRAREHATEVHDWPPLLASARAREGEVLEKLGMYEDAEAASHAAYFEAARAGAWESAANIATQLIFVVGFRRGRREEGRAWAEHAEVALLAYAGRQTGLAEADRLTQLALVQSGSDAYKEKQRLLARARAIQEEVLGPGHPDLASGLGNLANTYRKTGSGASGAGCDDGPLSGVYHLKSELLGDCMCLDGGDPRSADHGGGAFMTPCAADDRQSFQLTALEEGFHIRTVAGGPDRCLEGNDPVLALAHNGNAFMDGCGFFSGQYWLIVPDGDWFRLHNGYRGPGESLEANDPTSSVHDGAAFMDKNSGSKGQRWQLVTD